MSLFSLYVDSDEEDYPLTSSERERDKLSIICDELRYERDKLEEKVEFLRGEANKWESDCVHSNNAKKVEMHARTKVETQVHTLNAELKHQEEHNTRLQSELCTLKRRFADLENELQTEQIKIKALKRDLTKSTTGRTGRTFWDGYVERRGTLRSAKRANGTA
jgi:chromosome segregation ATPase